MKKVFKYIAIVLTIFICVFSEGCTGNDLSDISSLPNYSLYDTVSLDNLSFTPVEIAQVPPSSEAVLSAKDGNVFFIVKLDVKNNSEEEAIFLTHELTDDGVS